MSYTPRGLRKEDRYSRRVHRQMKREGVSCDGCYSCPPHPLQRVTRREWHQRRERIPALVGEHALAPWDYGEELITWEEYTSGWHSTGVVVIPNWVRHEAEEEYATECVLWALSGEEMCDVHGIPRNWCEGLSRWWYGLTAWHAVPTGSGYPVEWLFCGHCWPENAPCARPRRSPGRSRLWRAPRF